MFPGVMLNDKKSFNIQTLKCVLWINSEDKDELPHNASHHINRGSYRNANLLLNLLNKLGKRDTMRGLDIIGEHCLTQVVNIPSSNDKTLVLLITNAPSPVNKVKGMPPDRQS